MQQALSLSLVLLLGGCMVSEEAGSADYVLRNDSSRTLVIEWTGSATVGGRTETSDPVLPDAELAFAIDASIGSKPTPADSISSLRLLDETGAPVYVQDPVADDAWMPDPPEMSGYTHRDWILVVDDTDLSP